MSAPGLVQIWSLDLSSAGTAPPALNIDVWAVNHILLARAGVNNLASLLSVIPRSETRLRDEGILPFYSFMRNITNALKSTARELGVTVPDIPDASDDWSEEASADYKALAAQFRPHLAEPARATMDWIFGSRDRDPKLHWAVRLAIAPVTIDVYTRALLAMGEIMGGSEWGPLKALMASEELKGFSLVINEEILRIRAQPGSGWDEEEAKRIVKEQLGMRKEAVKVGT